MQLVRDYSDEAFDMAAEARLAGRTPDDIDSFVAAAANECLALEVGAIFDVRRFGQSCDGSNRIDFTFLEPGGLVAYGLETTSYASSAVDWLSASRR